MEQDEQNGPDWLFITLTVILGIAIVAFVAYTVFIYLDLSRLVAK